MISSPLTIWCNQRFAEPAAQELRERLRDHRLIFPANLSKSNLAAGSIDPALAETDVAFGQPDPQQCMELPRLKWIHLTTAGYTRYDRDDLRQAFRARGAILTNSSQVYAEPCAQHALAYMLAMARRLPYCVDDQRSARPWHSRDHRLRCRLLNDQTVLILGFGAIARRLVELLQPLRMNIIAVRRNVESCNLCRVISTEQTNEAIPQGDHVMNILPANPATDHFMNRARFELMKPGAIYYNIGRGTTQEQPALLELLQMGRLSAAYIDVTDPEPLPPDHPLWSAPNCYITPHTAGGTHDEPQRLVRHFANNLQRFVNGEPLNDRVV